MCDRYVFGRACFAGGFINSTISAVYVEKQPIEAGSLWKYISLIRDMAFERIREAHSSTYYPISTMQGRPGKFVPPPLGYCFEFHYEDKCSKLSCTYSHTCFKCHKPGHSTSKCRSGQLQVQEALEIAHWLHNALSGFPESIYPDSIHIMRSWLRRSHLHQQQRIDNRCLTYYLVMTLISNCFLSNHSCCLIISNLYSTKVYLSLR